MESGSGPQSPSPSGPQSPGPQSPGPQSPGPQSPRAPGPGPQSPGAPFPPSGGYTGPVPPGGWQQAPPRPPATMGGGALAGWWSRVGATVVDGLIIVIPSIVIMAVLGVGVAGSSASDSDAGIIAFILAFIVTAAVIAIVSLIYAPVLMMRSGPNNGQTIGKQLTGIRVIRDNGEPMDLGWAALREVVVKNFAVAIASSFTFGLAYLADVLWPLFDDQNRSLHDLVCSTHVVRA